MKPFKVLTGLASAIGAATVTAKDPNDLWVVYIPKGRRDVPEQTLDLKPVLDDKGQPKVMRVNVSQLSAKRLEAARQKIERAGGNQPYCDFNHEDAESSGRPKQFAWHDELGVVCRIARTLTGAAKTSGDPAEFQAFSPHTAMDDDGEAAGLYLNVGGFVNRPLFGDANNISAAARLTQELVAADPNDIAQVSAELSDVETQPAAQENTEMKQLIAKLCAAWKLDPEKVTEAELTAAWDTHTAGVSTLTAKAGLVEPVIVALGFDKAAVPKPEELTGKIAALGKQPDNIIQLADYAKELTGIAVATGLIAPAEQATWERRLVVDRVNEVKELTAKKPTVPLGTVVNGDTAGAGAAGNGSQQAVWEKELNELVAKDAKLVAVAATDMPRAKSLGIQKLMREKPALFATK
ncbi:MAG: hypothetical protein NTY01_05575 [Verrucomicrobia bacterium]|nr:hypothetical protein [Verrucomicrobiota bacterium]